MSREAKRYLAVAALLIVFSAITGCIENSYDLTLRPEGDSLGRELVFHPVLQNHGNPNANSPPDEELKLLKSLYEKYSTSDQGKKHHFQGTFGSRTPDDIGGSGWYLRWDTELGTVSGYVERFRGSDDLTIDIKQRQQAVDRTVDLLIGWMEKELGEEPGFEQFRTFLDMRFRKDFHNVSLYLFSLNCVGEPDEDVISTVSVRILQSFIERDYFAPEDIPALPRSIDDLTKRVSADRLLGFLQQLVAKKMRGAGEDENPISLSFLDSKEQFVESLTDYLKTTEEFRATHKKWESDPNHASSSVEPNPIKILTKPLFRALFGSLLSSGDHVNATLNLPRRPYRTNGDWEEEMQCVKWGQTLSERGDQDNWRMSAVFHCFWDEPNAARQRELFGKVILKGEPLESYVRWYLGLADAEKQQWDSLLSELTPDNFSDQLRTFRFENETTGDKSSEQNGLLLSEVPRRLLTGGSASGENTGGNSN